MVLRDPSTAEPADDGPGRWFCPDWEAALAWAACRQSAGISCSFDVLGEYARTGEEADAALAEDVGLIDRLRRHCLNGSLSLKYSALGFLVDPGTAARRGETVLEKASEAGVAVEIDMEGTPMVGWTLDRAEALARRGLHPTVALQAYLDRSEADLDRLLGCGLRVRLVKGAYQGDVQDFVAVQNRFRRLAERLLACGSPWCAGTHDPELLAFLREKAGRTGQGRLEFGFLKGLADQTKLDLRQAGWEVREYVPFGPHGNAYRHRRLAYLQNLAALGRRPAP